MGRKQKAGKPEQPDKPSGVGENPVGVKLASARESLGLTRSQAAERLGCSYQALAEIELGRRNVSLERLHGIAVGLGIDPHWLDERLASTSAGASASLQKLHSALAAFQAALAELGLPGGDPTAGARKKDGD